MTAHIKVSGVWKEITGAHYKSGGAWKEITEGWVNVSGVWKQFYNSSFLFDPGNQSYNNITGASTDARSGFRININGDVEEIDFPFSYTDRDDWFVSGADYTDYEIFVTELSGTVSFGTVDSWLDMSSGSRTWYCDAPTEAIKTCTVEVTIRHKTTTSDSITFEVSMYADSTSI